MDRWNITGEKIEMFVFFLIGIIIIVLLVLGFEKIKTNADIRSDEENMRRIDNETRTNPPYDVGDFFCPRGTASGWDGMVVSVKDQKHISAVSLNLDKGDFTSRSHINEVFDKYHLDYNKQGKTLSTVILKSIIDMNEMNVRHYGYFNGEGIFVLPTIEELENFFYNIDTYYSLRRTYNSYIEDFDIKTKSCQYFISRTLNEDATMVYVFDIKNDEVMALPINNNSQTVNEMYVLEYNY